MLALARLIGLAPGPRRVSVPLAIVALAVVLISPMASASDAAPYTGAAAHSLDRASKYIEAPRPESDDPTNRLVALIRYLDAVYARAGYSFDKSFARYLTDYQRTRVPELHVAATPLNQALGAMLELEPQGAQLDRVFKGETLRLAKAISTESRQEAIDRNAAAVRSKQAAEGTHAENLQQTLTRMGPLSEGRYYRDGRDRSQFLDLSWGGGETLTVSAEHFAKNRDSSLLCKLPPIDVPMKAYAGKELSGEASDQGCNVRLRVTERAATLDLNSGRGCASLCAAQGRMPNWQGGMYWSDEIRARFAQSADDQRKASLTQEQRSLQEELRARTASGSGADKDTTPPPQDDTSKTLKDATRALDNLFKRR